MVAVGWVECLFGATLPPYDSEDCFVVIGLFMRIRINK